MPRLRPDSLPAYRLHKQSGQAIVTLSGRDVLLGKHGSAASRSAYERVTAEWLSHGRRLPRSDTSLSITELVAAFWAHAQTYYATAVIGEDGKPSVDLQNRPLTAPSGELDNFRLVLGKNCPLRQLYGTTPAADFGPLKLQAVRAEMIKAGHCRTHLNRQLGRIKLVFKWAVAQELVPAGVHHGLTAITGIRKGRHGVRESQRVRPARDELVDATLDHLSPTVAAMVKLQRLAGMRSGEVCIMRGRDIETASKVWVYRPASHKTEHHDIRREILIGPQAIEIVRPFLRHDVDAYLFSPAEAERDRRLEQRQQRKTKVQPSQVKRAARAASRQRRRPIRDHYDSTAYRRAIARACKEAFPIPEDLQHDAADSLERQTAKREQRRQWRETHAWHPHQLRHAAATRIRRQFGLEAARVILGHQSTSMTELYAEQDMAKAAAIMGEVG